MPLPDLTTIADPRPPSAAPTETPECEASACHCISIPEAAELRTAWPGWIPLLTIVLVAACGVLFAVGRIAGW